MKNSTLRLLVGLAVSMFGIHFAHANDSSAPGRKWISLFNGKNLDGWTIKIAGRPLGENYADTFRVEDGIIKVAYDKYPKFGKQFGHLYSNVAYSRYILRMEYRFEGKMMSDAPSYVNLNSGVMIHSQSPQSLPRDQEFPASLEVQFLADEGKGSRPTGNMCSPGTHIEMNGKLITQHIVQSTAPTFAAGDWVKIEVEVHGYDEVIYRVNGMEVLRYQHPQLDPKDPWAAAIIKAGAARELHFGHIALQAEGQPVWFRNIEIMSLEKP
ncbi:3-keto-disaccharide hydrolase [Oleiharenicola lentus]|uniref:3-keto-disaccharide hydrolase n=1 Tax=Oleiharenicola lentus TaxID=2508720 RepID=UPI003F6758A0